jgi:hypothetical protein
MMNIQLQIKTKYIGPTDTKPSRISAVTQSGKRKVISWDHGLNVTENHEAAAVALFLQMHPEASTEGFNVRGFWWKGERFHTLTLGIE